MDLEDRKRALKEISNIAARIKNLTRTQRPMDSIQITSTSRSPQIPQLHLPFPQEIAAKLSAMALPDQIRRQMIRSLHVAVQKLKCTQIRKFEEGCQKLYSVPQSSSLPLMPVIIEKLKSTYEYHYVNHCIPLLEAKLVSVNDHKSGAFKKPVFNTEYTPLLGKYFSYNAYPSAIDRSFLARKAMMSPRQIEVWFQNHRRRAKKEGRHLSRLSCNPLPVNISLDSLLSDMLPYSMVPSKQRTADVPSYKRIDQETPKGDNHTVRQSLPKFTLCDAEQPIHAFPAIYTRNSTQNRIFSFPPPCWERCSMTRSSPSAILPIDIDEFVAMFANKLHIGGPKPLKRSTNPISSSSWFAASVTIPPLAPHPALVRLFPSSPHDSSFSQTNASQSNLPDAITSHSQPMTPSSLPKQVSTQPSQIHRSPLPSLLLCRSSSSSSVSSLAASTGSSSPSSSRSSSVTLRTPSPSPPALHISIALPTLPSSSFQDSFNDHIFDSTIQSLRSSTLDRWLSLPSRPYLCNDFPAYSTLDYCQLGTL